MYGPSDRTLTAQTGIRRLITGSCAAAGVLVRVGDERSGWTRLLSAVLGGATLLLVDGGVSQAQEVTGAYSLSTQPIDRIQVRITNPTGDAPYDDRMVDGGRRALGLFPGSAISDDRMISHWRQHAAILRCIGSITPCCPRDLAVSI